MLLAMILLVGVMIILIGCQKKRITVKPPIPRGIYVERIPGTDYVRMKESQYEKLMHYIHRLESGYVW